MTTKLAGRQLAVPLNINAPIVSGLGVVTLGGTDQQLTLVDNSAPVHNRAWIIEAASSELHVSVANDTFGTITPAISITRSDAVPDTFTLATSVALNVPSAGSFVLNHNGIPVISITGSSSVNFNNKSLLGVPSPASASAAANKAYVDGRIRSVTNDNTNSFDSSDVPTAGTIPQGGYMKITGLANMAFVSVLMKKSTGTFAGKYVLDFGAFLDAVEWSNTELRVYNNSGATLNAGDIKAMYTDEVA